MGDFLETLHAETRKIRMAADSLMALAEGFYGTGNSVVGDRLAKSATALIESQQAIVEAHSEELNRHLAEQHESIGRTLGALLGRIA